MPPLTEGQSGPAFWRSLEERADTPEFRRWVEAEFPSQADKILSPVSRRNFLKVMGASMALLGLSGCRWPEEEIVPYAHRPEGVTPGVPRQFASNYEIGGYGVPVLATSYDGRPIRVDGNPEHPLSRGASDAITQASVLELYDPDRSTAPVQGGVVSSWDAFETFAREHMETVGDGAGLAVLSEAVGSPTLARMRGRFLAKYPKARWHEYEPFGREEEREGLERATGKPLRALPRLESADLVVSFGDDLLYDHPTAIRNTRDFAANRRGEGMNRLHVVETGLSITGGSADHRFPRTVRGTSTLARAVAASVLDGTLAGDAAARRIAADLAACPGRSFISAGPDQPAEVHHLVFLMNRKLGNVGRTVDYFDETARPAFAASLAALVKAMGGGKVSTLLVLGGNPSLNAYADLGFAGALSKVRTRIHLGTHRDETAASCTWHLNRAHWLEAWSDVTAFDGSFGVTQPLIRALYEGRTPAELLALLLDEPERNGYDIVRRTATTALGESGFEKKWRKVLHDGFLADSAAKPAGIGSVKPVGPTGPEDPAAGLFELVIRRDLCIHDGRFANNGWLQELPDPVSKLTWDGAALMSPKDAETLGVSTGDHLKIAAGDASVTVPAFVLPGQAAGAVTLPAGYGRTAAGRVADGVGQDVYPLRTSKPGFAKVEKAGGRTKLACTQDHHAIDDVGRKAVERRMHVLVREATLEEYGEHPDFARHMVHHPPLESLWKEKEYEGRRWGMFIDLSSCTGCSACVVACQSENNIPVVGKDEVIVGREMHWIRVDRYFGGDPEDPSVRHQPVPCMQCENAPCEQVCPVAATVHTEEGLNDMVYNRCIGTRYCANNCPYKVRRFNWFKNHDGLNDIQKMSMNPEVTVRARGVMEKCTYCVQRISSARIKAKNEGRPVSDGEAVPACAQSCPANAITFGDLADPESEVAKLEKSPRAYGILEELNVKPRTKYLARIVNPGPETE